MGNLRSVAKALEHVAPKARVIVTQDRRDILHADRVVFPGQGSIRDCMRELAHWDLVDVVRAAALGKPFLGLCLGPQALLTFSEENGGVDGLNVLPGRVVWFGELREPETGERLKVPHMGWNQVRQPRDHPLWRDISQDSRFYFVHSYYLNLRSPRWPRAEPVTVSTSLRRSRGTTSSPCNSTRKRALRRDCDCSPISWTGTRNDFPHLNRSVVWKNPLCC
jgi:glutamine amidotransferase